MNEKTKKKIRISVTVLSFLGLGGTTIWIFTKWKKAEGRIIQLEKENIRLGHQVNEGNYHLGKAVANKQKHI